VTVDSASFLLSPVQQRLWRLPGGPRRVVVSRHLLAAGVGEAAVGAALATLVERHEALRTRFPVVAGMDMPGQSVAEGADLDLDLELWPVFEAAEPGPGESGDDPTEAVLRAAEQRLAREMAAGWEPATGPALAARLLPLPAGGGALLLATPVVVADPASHRILGGELERLLADGPEAAGGEAEERVQSLDVCEWQREILASEDGAEGRRVWSRRVEEVDFGHAWPGATPASGDLAEPPTRRAGGSADGVGRRLRSLAREAGVTPQAVLLAAWAVVLRRHRQTAAVTLGRLHEGRGYEELAGLVGSFSRHLPLTLGVPLSRTFRDLVAEAGRSVSAGDEWEEYFAWSEAAAEGDAAPALPFLFEHLGDGAGGVGTVRGQVEPALLKLTTALAAEDLAWHVEADGERLPGGEAARLGERFATLLTAALETPERAVGDLDLLSAAESAQLAGRADGGATAALTTPAAGAVGVDDAFVAAAAKAPDAVALVDRGHNVTFGELERRSRALAVGLLAAGVGPEHWVLLAFERGAAQLVAALAVMRAGAAFVPVAPRGPTERMRRVAESAAAAARLWWWAGEGEAVPEGLDADPLPADPSPVPGAAGATLPAADGDRLAYVLFTSGSSGRPKGVMVRHRSLLALAGALERRVYEPLSAAGTPVRRVAMNAQLHFDASVKQWLQWLAGRGVWLVPQEARQDGERFLAEFARHRPQVVDCTPSQMRLLVAAGLFDAPAAAGTFLLGGEAVPAALWRRFASHPGLQAHNVYGPTETTVDATTAVVAGDEPHLGTPIPGWRVHLVDPRLGAVPQGAVGEIAIAGAGLARGYAGRPRRTATAFVPDPFAATAGGRLYLSGDLGRWRPGGELEYVGRRDRQVKIAGRRFELEEVEAALAEHPAVAEAAALFDDAGAAARLVAYIALRPEAEASPSELADHLAHHLPAWAVPAAYVFLDHLPLTRNGKVDHAALPSPEEAETPQAGSVAQPRTPFEEMLAAVWREVLGVERVGVDISFFDLGGHSLLAAQLVARVRQVFQVELPLRHLFDEPTVRQLAARLAVLLRDGAEPLPPVVALPREGGVPTDAPASFGQERLWFLERLEPGKAAYNLAASVDVEGDLDAAALGRALGRLEERHEILRTTLHEPSQVDADGAAPVPVQRVSRRLRLCLPTVDLGALADEPRRAELVRRTEALALTPFDLAAGPLFRAFLFRLGDQRWRVMTVLHHAVSDAWSVGVLYRDLTAYYRAEGGDPEAAEALPELPVQYADYAVWQRRHLDRDGLAEALAWWRHHLGGDTPVLTLSGDRPRPAEPSFAGATAELRLRSTELAAVEGLARRHGVTTFMALLAAWGLLLARWAGSRRLTVGVPVANRDRLEVEELIGFFVNTLVMRVSLPPGRTGAELLAAVREEALAAFAHQEVPFERLVEELAPGRHLGASPLFQVMYMHQNTPRSPLRLPELTFGVPRNEGRTSPFDLSLMTSEEDGVLRCQLEYATDVFDPTTAERILAAFRRLLAGLAATPEAAAESLPLVSPAERRQVVAEWNDTARGAAEPPLPERLQDLVWQRAAEAPDGVAVAAGGRHLTYGALVERADGLARYLAAAGVAPEVPVAVFMDRVPELALAHLAILAAGGACLPLDPDLPPDRLAFLLRDAAAPLVLTRGALIDRLPEGVDVGVVDLDGLDVDDLERDQAAPPPVAADPANAAYLIYTSGSTGRPKGVAVTHRNLAGYTVDMVRRFRMSPRDRVLQFAALSFDVVLEELFPAWAAGATVVLEPARELADPAAFSDLLRRRAVTWCELPASYWHDWMGDLALRGEAPPGCLRLLVLGSEKPAAETVAAWERFAIDTIYIFGLTETSVTSSLLHLPDPRLALRRHDLPIGRPVDDASLYVLDGRGEVTPVGVPGELFVGGAGVGRGYVGRPALTASRFLPDPFSGRPGARLYRTGDRSRWLADGQVDFLGRTDHQINLRGLRIEPGEVETALESHPSVREAVVAVRTAPTGGDVLVAWVAVGEGGAAVSDLRRELRAAARERLPEGMVPGLVVPVASLPKTPHGKVDRQALPSPDWSTAGGEGGGELPTRPSTPLEEVLAGIWRRVLKVDEVRPDSDFFALGGHSLLATRLLARVRRELGVEPPLRRLFEAPRLADFAAAVEAERRRGGFTPPPFTVPGPGDAGGLEAPLSFAQRRLWYMHRLDPESVAYNMPSALRLRGELSVAALTATLSEVVRRHRVLRTGFGDDPSEPRPRVVPAGLLELPVADLSELAPEAAVEGALELARREAVRPLNPDAGPVLRARLLRLAADHHLLLLTIHHIAFDAWSQNVLVDEVRRLYPAFTAGGPSPLPELAAGYADYARWQRGWLRGEVLEGYLDHWRRHLADLPESPLPTDRPRPETGGQHGGNLFFRLPEGLAGDLRRLSQERGATLFMTLLAAFDLLLWEASGRRAEDVVVGTDVANRTLAESEAMIGFFVNQLVLRTRLDGDLSFAELLQRVRATTLDAYEHQDLPFDELVRALRPRRQVDRHPLFQVKLVLQNEAGGDLEAAGLHGEAVRFDRGVAKFDLLFDVEDTGGALEGRAEYDADLFEKATVERLVARWRRFLELAVERPDAALSSLADTLRDDDVQRSAAAEDRLAAAGLASLKRRRPARRPAAGEET